MVDRICISINNRCNLACKYCHFHEKKECIQEKEMDVFKILDNVIYNIEKMSLNKNVLNKNYYDKYAKN